MRKEKVLRILSMLAEIDYICDSSGDCVNCPLHKASREGYTPCGFIDWEQVANYEIATKGFETEGDEKK